MVITSVCKCFIEMLYGHECVCIKNYKHISILNCLLSVYSLEVLVREACAKCSHLPAVTSHSVISQHISLYSVLHIYVVHIYIYIYVLVHIYVLHIYNNQYYIVTFTEQNKNWMLLQSTGIIY